MSHACMVWVHALACVRSHVCGCMCACAGAGACMRVHACACGCGCMRVHVRAGVHAGARVRGCGCGCAGVCVCAYTRKHARSPPLKFFEVYFKNVNLYVVWSINAAISSHKFWISLSCGRFCRPWAKYAPSVISSSSPVALGP